MEKKVSILYSTQDLYLGCDPEFFFSKKGKVLGAEKILPEDGMKYDPRNRKARENDGAHTAKCDTVSKIIIDGVQAELNPRPNTCRANLGNEIGACFRELYQKIKADKALKVDFEQVKEVTKDELASLSEKARTFGCAPSKNAYSHEENKITVNPAEYKYRSAGGHIHLGCRDTYGPIAKALLEKRERVVQMLDIIVGNTCVLIDRDPYAKERRKVYGRAGDYRTPSYGIEYRTLSNFWLRSYQLMSFVMGMARIAVQIVAYSTPTNNYEKLILDVVDVKEVAEAINNNDFEVAYDIYKKVEKVLLSFLGEDSHFPITQSRSKYFHHFLNEDLGYWFKDDPLQHWVHLPEGHETGWEAWVENIVYKDMRDKERKAKVNSDAELAYWAE